MRYRCILAVAFVSVLSGAIPAAAHPRAHSTLLVEPSRADFDRDGRPDVAAVGPWSDRSIVRITFSRSGVRELGQPGLVQSIAGFDFDHDGDLDLLVGTSEGAVVWLNEGFGVFVPEPLHLASVPDDPARMTLVVVSGAGTIDRDDPVTVRPDLIPSDSTRVARSLPDGTHSPLSLFASASSPRAPPRASL